MKNGPQICREQWKTPHFQSSYWGLGQFLETWRATLETMSIQSWAGKAMNGKHMHGSYEKGPTLFGLMLALCWVYINQWYFHNWGMIAVEVIHGRKVYKTFFSIQLVHTIGYTDHGSLQAGSCWGIGVRPIPKKANLGPSITAAFMKYLQKVEVREDLR